MYLERSLHVAVSCIRIFRLDISARLCKTCSHTEKFQSLVHWYGAVRDEWDHSNEEQDRSCIFSSKLFNGSFSGTTLRYREPRWTVSQFWLFRVMFLSVNSVRQLRRVGSTEYVVLCSQRKDLLYTASWNSIRWSGLFWCWGICLPGSGRRQRQYIANSLEGSDTLENYTVNVYFSVRGYTCGDCDHKIVSIVSITVTELHLLQAH